MEHQVGRLDGERSGDQETGGIVGRGEDTLVCVTPWFV